QFVACSFRAIEPRVRIDFPQRRIIGMLSVEDAKGTAFRIERVLRKPALRNARRTGKPLAAVGGVANKQRICVSRLDELNRSSGVTCVEDVGHCTDGLEV